MTRGAGKYDDACTAARESTGARAVALIVAAGRLGSGFSVQCDDAEFLRVLPVMLRHMADEMERGLPPNGASPDS